MYRRLFYNPRFLGKFYATFQVIFDHRLYHRGIASERGEQGIDTSKIRVSKNPHRDLLVASHIFQPPEKKDLQRHTWWLVTGGSAAR